MVTVLSVPAGASLTAVTLMVIVLADWSRSTPAIGGAAVVLHLEGEGGVARAVGVGRRREHQQAGIDVGDADELARRHGDAVVGQAAGARQRGDLDRRQRIGRAVVRIAEAEVGRGEDVSPCPRSVVTVLSVPAGASLTAVTLMVSVLAD